VVFLLIIIPNQSVLSCFMVAMGWVTFFVKARVVVDFLPIIIPTQPMLSCFRVVLGWVIARLRFL
jgi:hypothetical protein